MDNESKQVGSNGGFYLDNSFTGGFVYMIHVLDDAVFTTLKEGDEDGSAGSDVMSEQNLTGKTVKAGAMIVPTDEIFTDATISSGSCYCYKVGD